MKKELIKPANELRIENCHVWEFGHYEIYTIIWAKFYAISFKSKNMKIRMFSSLN